MIIEYEELSKDKLTKLVWGFWLKIDHNNIQLHLDRFIEYKRPTTRHKFKWAFGQLRYHRLMHRENNLDKNDVDIPDYVMEDVKTRLHGIITQLDLIR